MTKHIYYTGIGAKKVESILKNIFLNIMKNIFLYNEKYDLNLCSREKITCFPL